MVPVVTTGISTLAKPSSASPRCRQTPATESLADQAPIGRWNRRHPGTFCFLDLEKNVFRWRQKVIYRVSTALFASSLVVGAAAAQSTTPSGDKPETSCTTSSAATTGSAGDQKSNSMAMEKSAILPDAAGTNSAAPTVQSDGKSMEVRPDCPPEPKLK
jgi:hypothetical protein